jgi:elongation factor P
LKGSRVPDTEQSRRNSLATTADFRNGMVIRHKNDLYRIVEFQHVKPGKGGAFVRSKLKNLKTGRVIDETWNAGENVDLVRLTRRPIQYLYAGGDEYHFMDNESYDQFSIPVEMIRPYLSYLLENMTMEAQVQDDGTIVDIEFPPSVILQVTEAHDAARGDSAGSITKPVKVETGLELQVPPFIKQGERIRIDTQTGKYIERA